jgi:hypothetical protein
MPPDKDPDSSSPQFEGFDIPRQNWFKMPNSWTDITAEIGGIAELKVVEYVLKHTWGYQEFEVPKHITNDEFMNGRRRKDGTRIDKGTGLSKKSVISGLKNAVAHGLLIEEIDDSDRARVKKSYYLRMAPWVEEERQTEDEPLEEYVDDNGGVKKVYPGVTKVYPRGVESIPRTEKDTLERQQQKDTNSNNSSDDGNSESAIDQKDVVVALSSQGVSKSVSQRLAREYSAELIAGKIEYLEYLLAERPDELKRPAAWLRKAIEDDYAAPDGFVSVEVRERQASEENRRKQAATEALRQQRELIEAQERERDEERASQRAALREQYGTTQEDEEFWQDVLKELRYGVGLANFALIADSVILQVTEDRAVVGISSESKYRDLQHPGQQKQIQRALKSVAKRDMEIEINLLNSN